jgi:dipeptidase D
MNLIAEYCMDFAKKHSLNALRDNANNIIIFKNGTAGYEGKNPVILQAHLDMVNQKTDDANIDFSKTGPKIIVDGDFIKAENTTLGADNGIGVAMILALLESKTAAHPPIEAVFTTDEEIGMIGATALDVSPLKGKRLINLDSENDDTVTVSCAGGTDLIIKTKLSRHSRQGTKVSITVNGLKGGHSGTEINKSRENANILAGRLLTHLRETADFEIISVNGGDKSNAITPSAKVVLFTENPQEFTKKAENYLDCLKRQISDNEPDFSYKIEVEKEGQFKTVGRGISDKLISYLSSAPYGVIEMSRKIAGLVETSVNPGIFETADDEIRIVYSIRSNDLNSLKTLSNQLEASALKIDGTAEFSGSYPPWEFNDKSELLRLYTEVFAEHYGFAPKIEAIHAGLECGIFASKIKGLECISVGPSMFGIHTVFEKLSISSTKRFFELLLKVLERM